MLWVRFPYRSDDSYARRCVVAFVAVSKIVPWQPPPIPRKINKTYAKHSGTTPQVCRIEHCVLCRLALLVVVGTKDDFLWWLSPPAVLLSVDAATPQVVYWSTGKPLSGLEGRFLFLQGVVLLLVPHPRRFSLKMPQKGSTHGRAVMRTSSAEALVSVRGVEPPIRALQVSWSVAVPKTRLEEAIQAYR